MFSSYMAYLWDSNLTPTQYCDDVLPTDLMSTKTFYIVAWEEICQPTTFIKWLPKSNDIFVFLCGHVECYAYHTNEAQ